jgi:predicted esterase
MSSTLQARLRVLRIPALCSVFFLCGCSFEQSDDEESIVDNVVAQALTTDLSVYANATLGAGWQNWSWSTTAVFANTDAPLAAGSTSHIRATASSAWGALSLARTTGDLSTSEYDAISFDVRGSTSSSVRIALETLGGTGSGTEVTVPLTTTWTRQSLKLDALKGPLTQFGKIDWISTQAGQTFYVDNVRLVAKPAPSAQAVSLPSAPISVRKSEVVTLNSSAGPYYLYVPNGYDASHKTPTRLLVWLHGCGGDGYGDAWTVSPGGNQSWISVSIGGRDGACWNPNTDVPMPLAALDDVKRRLNIDPRRVVIGGYSSGGDMAYRTAFYNAKQFAGVLAENTSPFRDTGSSQSTSLAATAWKFNVAHVAHLGDTVYPIAGVRTETDAVKSAGFPLTRIERPGTHWDADTSSSGTNYDLRKYLLTYLDAGWVAPL